jgi:hypothetical protein
MTELIERANRAAEEIRASGTGAGEGSERYRS